MNYVINEFLNYHDRPEYSRSDITHCAEGRWRDFEAYKITKTLKVEETDDMLVGTLTHAKLLEPHLESKIVAPPDHVLSIDKNGVKSRRGDKYKAWKAANPDLVDLHPADIQTAALAYDSIMKEAGPLITNPDAIREKTIVWEDEETGLPLRVKPDLCVPTKLGFFIPDIKTTSDLFWFKKKEIFDRHLYLQHAMYTEGVKHEFQVEDPKFFFLAVEKRGVFRCRAIPLGDAIAARGHEIYRKILRDLRERLDRCPGGDWSEEGEDELEDNAVTEAPYGFFGDK